MSDDKRFTRWESLAAAEWPRSTRRRTRMSPVRSLVAAADIDAGKLDLFCERWSIPHRYDSYEEMLAQADVDIVSVCTMDNLKGPVTIAAAGAGARGHPLREADGLHLEEADRMIAACDRAGTKLIVNHSIAL